MCTLVSICIVIGEIECVQGCACGWVSEGLGGCEILMCLCARFVVGMFHTVLFNPPEQFKILDEMFQVPPFGLCPHKTDKRSQAAAIA